MMHLTSTRQVLKNTVNAYIELALFVQGEGRSLPFSVVDNLTGNIIATTRFCHDDYVNKRVEIGYTWYARNYKRTSVNTECKHLIFHHAFEPVFVIAVEFRTHRRTSITPCYFVWDQSKMVLLEIINK
jgi:RimJ/RimL family protein N-acetyltransferase